MKISTPLLLASLPVSLALAAPSAPQDVWTQQELETVTAEIQKDVESIRGQEFQRPVNVKITDKAGFLGYAKKRMDEMSRPNQMSIEGDIGKLLGLLPAEMDLEKAVFDLLEGQVGGFYDPASDTFYLMESFTGGVAKVILAHELTHALDDQLYGLDDDFERLKNDRDASAAYQAVVEGSGTAAMSSWMMAHAGELTQEELMEAATMGTDELAEAPEMLWKPLLASYTQGQSFLNYGYKQWKKEGKTMTDVIAAAFAQPPTSTEQILHPKKYWDADAKDAPKPVTITTPAREGWDVLDRGTLGELNVALFTAEPKEIDFKNPMSMLSIRYTNKAAEGWGGDALELRGKGDARWLVLETVWDTADDAAEFTAALAARTARWTAAVDAMSAATDDSGIEVRVDPSDPLRVNVYAWSGANRDQLGL